MSFFSFSDLTYAQKTWKKAIIPVDKNKPKCETLFGAIYLKKVCGISSKSVLEIRRNKFTGENSKLRKE